MDMNQPARALVPKSGALAGLSDRQHFADRWWPVATIYSSRNARPRLVKNQRVAGAIMLCHTLLTLKRLFLRVQHIIEKWRKKSILFCQIKRLK
jgi:hypothetical protein